MNDLQGLMVVVLGGFGTVFVVLLICYFIARKNIDNYYDPMDVNNWHDPSKMDLTELD